MAAATALLQSYVSPFFKQSIVCLQNRNTSKKSFGIAKINSTYSVYQPLTDQRTVHKKTQMPDFSFNEYMNLKVNQVNEALEEILSLDHQSEIKEAMRYSLLSSGKRIRAVLCLASCDLVGGNESEAMSIACAIEMIHAMSLMFDDLPCLDNDDIRRGIPSNHKVFGEEGTVLAGTSLVFLAFQHIVASTKNISPKRVLRSIFELSSLAGFDGLLGGELLDVRSEGKQVGLADLDHINSLKTSKLFEASVVCGAIIGGGNDVEIERLRKYATHIGLCLQVGDDILDMNKSYEGKREILKTIYPNLIGVDGARKCVEEGLVKALEELSHFEVARAAPLYHMANYVANLKN